eukprot:Sdes_comp20362_c1_seq1m14164
MRLGVDKVGFLVFSLVNIYLFFSLYTIIIVAIIPWLADSAKSGCLILLLCLLFLFLYTSFLRASLANPGFIALPPAGLDFSDAIMTDGFYDSESVSANHQLLSSSSGSDPAEGWSVCRKCSAYCPYGSSHCVFCNRCLSRQFLHSRLVHNCVGPFNLKFFFLFLLYSLLYHTLSLVLIVLRLRFVHPQEFVTERYDSKILLVSLCLGIGFFFSLAASFYALLKRILSDTKTPPELPQSWISKNIHPTSRIKKFLGFIFLSSPFYQWFLPCFGVETAKIEPRSRSFESQEIGMNRLSRNS